MKWSNNYFDVEGEPRNLKVTQKVGGSVAIPFDGEQFLLIEIKRKDGQYHLEFPRGFQEGNETPEENAARELKEETDLDLVAKPILLGHVMPDSGWLNSKISLVLTPIDFTQTTKVQKSEGIDRVRYVNKHEMLELIAQDKIVDSFTLAGTIKAITYFDNLKKQFIQKHASDFLDAVNTYFVSPEAFEAVVVTAYGTREYQRCFEPLIKANDLSKYKKVIDDRPAYDVFQEEVDRESLDALQDDVAKVNDIEYTFATKVARDVPEYGAWFDWFRK